jgi:DNA polymerase-3 subunit beta
MKLNIERETLLEPLQTVIGVVERRQTMPILANVLLLAEGAQLSVIATDMEIELIANATLTEPVTTPLQLTLSGRKLLDIFRTLPQDATIDLQQDKGRVIVRSGRSRFMLATLPVESFPRFEAATPTLTQTLTQKDFSALLQRSQFAMAQQDVRYYLNGMLIDIKDNKIRTVATDGHRFAMNGKSTETEDKAAQIILPRKSVLELLRLLKHDDSELAVEIGDNHIRVSNPAFTFTSRLIDGRFPDYERVLPKEKGNSITLNRETLKDALMRVSILSNEKFRAVRLQLRSGFLHILANNPEQEEAEEILSIDYAGEELDIAFNVVYLLDVLNTITGETIRFTFIDSNSRMLIEEESDDSDSMFLVMPLQL